MESYWLKAEIGAGPIWNELGEVDPESLPLSDRLLVALADWTAYFGEVSGHLGEPDTAGEFVGQGFKIAHGLKRELKGRKVFYAHPLTGEEIPITRKPR